jgi:hypothetical protein
LAGVAVITEDPACPRLSEIAVGFAESVKLPAAVMLIESADDADDAKLVSPP